MDRIRVLIADDEQIVRESLAGVIGSDPSLEIVGSAQDAQGAIDLAAWRLPDVALLDVRMPGGGPRAAAEIEHEVITRQVARMRKLVDEKFDLAEAPQSRKRVDLVQRAMQTGLIPERDLQ